jgi:dihydrofolate reductase/thymidylate synthase
MNNIETILITNDNNPNYKCYKTLYDLYISGVLENNNVYVYGSFELIDLCLSKYKNVINTIYYTQVNIEVNTDDPKFVSEEFINEMKQNNNNSIIVSENMKHYKVVYKEHEEFQYLKLLNRCLTDGDYRMTRNSLTFSNFGDVFSFDLTKGFPLITTKKVFIRGIFEELMFFLRGQTNSKILEKKGVSIWAPNTSSSFIINNGLPYKEGDMGPLYGFNWNHFGAKYVDCMTDYTNQGFNQIEYILDNLLNDAHSRRIIMTDFNPSCAKQGVLYPCHSIVIQMYVDDNKLSCNMYQRSGDLFLGIPFNIASTSLLVHIIAKLTNLNVGTVNLIIGDYHIYKNHLDAILEQLSRIPFDLPSLDLPNFFTLEQVEQSTYTDYKIINYQCNTHIKADMIA